MSNILVLYSSMYGHVETMDGGTRPPSKNELDIARFQVRHMAQLAAKRAG